MISLDDAELDAVMNAAAPLQPQARSAFLIDVAAELGKHRELGPGIVGRVCRDLQRRHRDPPTFNSPAKYE